MEDMYILHQLPVEEPVRQPEHPIMNEALATNDFQDDDFYDNHFFEDIAEFNAYGASLNQTTPEEPEETLDPELPEPLEIECNLWPELFCDHWEMELAEAYVRAQPLEDIYAPEEGLMMGTVFPNLLKPYEGRP